VKFIKKFVFFLKFTIVQEILKFAKVQLRT